MKVNCLAGGHTVELDEAYGNYEGQVKCFVCGAILDIKAEEGSLKSVKFVKIATRPSAEEVFERTR